MTKKDKEIAVRSSISIFVVLAFFIPATVWEHDSVMRLSDFIRIVFVPIFWYLMEGYFWPFVNKKLGISQ